MPGFFFFATDEAIVANVEGNGPCRGDNGSIEVAATTPTEIRGPNPYRLLVDLETTFAVERTGHGWKPAAIRSRRGNPDRDCRTGPLRPYPASASRYDQRRAVGDGEPASNTGRRPLRLQTQD